MFYFDLSLAGTVIELWAVIQDNKKLPQEERRGVSIKPFIRDVSKGAFIPDAARRRAMPRGAARHRIRCERYDTRCYFNVRSKA